MNITTKTDLFPIFMLAIFFISPVISFSQVGINTTNPRKALEVGGDMKIHNNYEIGTINPLLDTDNSTFLVQESEGYLESLDVSNPTGAALGYIQEYIITNPELDWVRDFDTGIDANDYVMVVISASYDLELKTSNSNNAPDNTSLPYTATFISGDSWHIIADYPMVANLDPSEIGTWTLQTLIFSKDLSKQFGTVEIEMANSTTGAALLPIID